MEDNTSKIKMLIQSRKDSREKALAGIEPNSLDNLPDAVRISREQQAAQLRAVIQEQDDLLNILYTIYPTDKKADQ